MPSKSRFSRGIVELVAAAGAMAAAALAACGGGDDSSSATSGDGGTVVTATGACTDAPPAKPITTTDAGTLAGTSAGGPIFEDAFTNYQTWQTYALDSDVDAGPHVSGPRTEWINKLPPHGSTEFPLGTIIVKNIPSIGQTFAMEKRGQGYNSAGANGWEYFDLQTNCDGTATIIWRGVGPPSGETYGGDPTQCNTCHSSYAGNDFVPSPPLQLSNF